MNEEPNVKKDPLPPALRLAFAPTAMAPTVIAVALLAAKFEFNLPETGQAVLLCLASAMGCFTPSVTLFRRQNGPATLGGILFLPFNGFIAFGSGCAAWWSEAKF